MKYIHNLMKWWREYKSILKILCNMYTYHSCCTSFFTVLMLEYHKPSFLLKSNWVCNIIRTLILAIHFGANLITSLKLHATFKHVSIFMEMLLLFMLFIHETFLQIRFHSQFMKYYCGEPIIENKINIKLNDLIKKF